MDLRIKNVAGISADAFKSHHHVSPRRLEKISKLRFAGDKARSLGAELLLNEILSERIPGIKLPAEWETDASGKPYLITRPDIFFSLSHSGDYAACALSSFPVGVDIQRFTAFKPALAKRALHEEEYENVMSVPEPERDCFFSKLWALKESYMKSRGLGFALPLKSFRISIGETIAVKGGVDGEYVLRLHDAPAGYALATCAKKVLP